MCDDIDYHKKEPPMKVKIKLSTEFELDLSEFDLDEYMSEERMQKEILDEYFYECGYDEITIKVIGEESVKDAVINNKNKQTQ